MEDPGTGLWVGYLLELPGMMGVIGLLTVEKSSPDD